MTNQIETTITNEAIDELRHTIRQSWITSVAAIYAFGKEHSRASIEASLKEIGQTLTKKANAFTGAAKLGLSEQVNGSWQVCDGLVSRYSRVCNYLNRRKIPVDGVEQALEGKTMTELVQNKTKKKTVTQDQFEAAVEAIKQRYPSNKLFDFGDDKLPVSQEAGLRPGANMALVTCDLEGNITAIRGLGNDDKHFWEVVVAKEGKAAASDNDKADPLNDALAVAKAA